MPQPSSFRTSYPIPLASAALSPKPSHRPLPVPPRPVPKEPTKERRLLSSASPLSSNPLAKTRPLPLGPGPLDERGRKLVVKGRGSRGQEQLPQAKASSKRVPMRADHSLGVRIPHPPVAPAKHSSTSSSSSTSSTSSSPSISPPVQRKASWSQSLQGAPSARCSHLQDPWDVQDCLRDLPSPRPRRSPSLGRLETREPSPALSRSSSLRRLNLETATSPGGGGSLHFAPQDVMPRTSWTSSGLPTRSGREHLPQERQRKDKREAIISIGNGQTGLRNLGNTCFMNAILQCLSNTRELRDYCIWREYLLDVNESAKGRCELMDAFADLIAALWDPTKSGAVTPLLFLQTFQRLVPLFMGYSQQDAQEFLRFLMDWLHMEINRKSHKAPSITSVSTIRGLTGSLERMRDDEKSFQMWKKYLERDDSKIVDLFVGQLSSTLRCTSCGYKSSTFEVFCDLSLPIPKKMSVPSRVTLADCLSLFTAEEELDAENAPMCERCNQKKRSTKKLMIQRFPKILVLHLNRFAFSHYAIRKCTTFVDFPLYGLSLRHCSADKAGNSVYDLYAVCNHTGTVNGGHYTAYCKSSSKWHVYNDSRVSLIQDNQVVSSESYLLFYELEPRVLRR
ncbi:ubiquitin carboxyl-terminal hydrolase 2-like isoform X2 [Narcine bancroftii]|uniref:ubiquitin carboxyl-terminal hydrolase 2-like isoform X2 n=1 Tax=Narcine bancroftii TaxID=1343680 RepID=UPI003831019A